jgi:tRNA pseudouridine38-40 synthase
MPRIALGIEYDGSAFRGWQSQESAVGIQSVVESALAAVADHPVEVMAAGRTDAGVHALMQVVHFDTDAQRSDRAWTLGATSNLPKQISVLWARGVSDAFHARYSAQSRSYRYYILNRPIRPAIGADYVSWVREPLDADRMHRAAQLLLGEHDFTSFRAAQCQSRTPMRFVHSITVSRTAEIIELAITANAFLHHMVRNIAGVLIAIGTGERPVEWTREVLETRDRTQGGITAPPGGLYLTAVRYASALQLPSERNERPAAVSVAGVGLESPEVALKST